MYKFYILPWDVKALVLGIHIDGIVRGKGTTCQSNGTTQHYSGIEYAHYSTGASIPRYWYHMSSYWYCKSMPRYGYYMLKHWY